SLVLAEQLGRLRITVGRSNMGDQNYVGFGKLGVVCSPPDGLHINDLALVGEPHTVTRNRRDLQIAARGFDDVVFEFRLLHHGCSTDVAAAAPSAASALIRANIRPCHSRRERWRRILSGAGLPM